MVCMLWVAPRGALAAIGDGAASLVTLEGDRIVWHRDASPGEPPLIAGVASRAMAAAGDTNVRDSDAALRVLAGHSLTRGWALLRMGERALAAGDTTRAESLLAGSDRTPGLWQADARRKRHDIALARGNVRAALDVLGNEALRPAPAAPRGEWEWLRARHLVALGDTAGAVRALGRMQAEGAPSDSAVRAVALLDRLMAGRTGSAPGEDDRLAARLLGTAGDTRGRITRLERALGAVETPRARFEISLGLGSFYRRAGRYSDARTLLRGLTVPADSAYEGVPRAAREKLDRGRRLVSLGDLERSAGRPGTADAHYEEAAALLVRAAGVKRSAPGYAEYREAIQDRADLAFSRGQTTRARDVFAGAPATAPDGGVWQLRAGILSLLLSETNTAERHLARADDSAFWRGVVRRRLGRPGADSLLAAAAARDDFEFYTAAARESLGLAARPIAPASGAPRADGPRWIREAELLLWLGLDDEAGTMIDRSIPWQSEVRSEGAFDAMGYTERAHWVRAARIAYLTGRYATGIRVAHRARWTTPHGVPSDLDRESVLPWMYPPAYDSLYAVHGAKQGIEPALLTAIGWQESFFDAKAVSRAGALGVMQFMSATARGVARQMGEPAPSDQDMLDAARSIRFGAHYFAGLLSQFGGAVPPALAAYNAGPGRARTWIRRANGDTGALFCEVIGFDETINYVKNILGAWQAYQWMRPRWEP
jgi:tetratricopeptide (TPR) repeat protein